MCVNSGGQPEWDSEAQCTREVLTNVKKRVLVLCTGNSCRSQMAEGWINHELGDSWQACSAGTRPAEGVNPLAIRAMAEVGIDISKRTPALVDAFLDQPWELVVTVCDSAKESCPIFPRPVETLHLSFPDPAAAEGTEAERLAVFRQVRDAIRARLLPEVARRG
jgi:arsenate reductase (thioredoxin)